MVTYSSYIKRKEQVIDELNKDIEKKHELIKCVDDLKLKLINMECANYRIITDGFFNIGNWLDSVYDNYKNYIKVYNMMIGVLSGAPVYTIKQIEYYYFNIFKSIQWVESDEEIVFDECYVVFTHDKKNNIDFNFYVKTEESNNELTFRCLSYDDLDDIYSVSLYEPPQLVSKSIYDCMKQRGMVYIDNENRLHMIVTSQDIKDIKTINVNTITQYIIF